MTDIRFDNPEKSQVVIFDNEGSEVIARMVLEGIDQRVLHARFERFYITPRILFLMFKNRRHIETTHLKSVRQFIGNLYRIYLLSCVQYIGPKVVVTFIDNSYAFQFISRRYKEAYFLAIQNGIRSAGDLRDWLSPVPEPGSVISMPVLCCFGDYEREMYKKYDHQVDVFYPVGSVRAGYYKSQIGVKPQEKEFDVCLISQWHEGVMNGKLFPEIGIGLKNLYDYLKRYLEERKLKSCIALRSNNPQEEEYFIGKYTGLAHLEKNDSKNMSSYRAIDKSSVIVALDSTLAREAFGWGAKVLFCNLSGDDLYTFPSPGFWSITELDYELFKNRLDYMMSLDEAEYRQHTKACAQYVMNSALEKPPQDFIRELILEQLVINSNVEKR